jgi:hypothetical protein
MSFMALNVCMSNILLQRQVDGMKEDETRLAAELERYLENIDRNSR